MTGRVIGLWRHPIKSHGREEVAQATLTAGRTMPGDRVWAVAHERSRADGTAWASTANFCRAVSAPQLMAITARLDGDRVTLRHPARPELSFAPDTDQAAFLAWVGPLMPEGRPAPARIIRVPGRGMTDSAFPSLTICNMASHRAVEQKLGRDLSIHRWRGNIWLDGLAPWEEFDWIGRDIRIGQAVLRVRERTARCAATEANPETGRRDAPTLATLETWGHRDFSVMAEVVGDGDVARGDTIGTP